MKECKTTTCLTKWRNATQNNVLFRALRWAREAADAAMEQWADRPRPGPSRRCHHGDAVGALSCRTSRGTELIASWRRHSPHSVGAHPQKLPRPTTSESGLLVMVGSPEC
eukprot:4544791-Amphidinium_carterae.1